MGSSHVSQAGATLGLEDLLAEMNNASSEADVSAALDALPPMEVSDPLGQLMQPQDNDATLPDLGTVVTPEQVAAEAGKGKGKKASKPKTEKPVAVKAAKPTTKKATTPSKKKKAPEVDAQPETVAADSAPAVTPEVTPEAPKPTPKPRVFFGRNKIGRLEHKFGSNLGKFLVLKVSDAELEGDAFDAKVAETKAMIKALGTKVQTRATNLIEFIGGQRATLNPVIEIALRTLGKMGKLESGDKGNLHVRLIGKYVPTAARAMGNNTINMLKNLGLVEENGKQTFTPCAESTLLALVSERLALGAFVDNAAAIAEVEEQERLQREATLQGSDNTQTLASGEHTPAETPADGLGSVGALIDNAFNAAQQEQLEAIAAEAI